MPILYCTYCVRVNFYFLSGMHECGKTPAAPASNAWGTLLLARLCYVQLFLFIYYFFFRFTTHANARGIGLIRANSGRIGPIDGSHRYPRQSIDSSRNWKKKKRCEMHHLAEIIIKGAKCTVWTKTTKPYIIFSPQLSHFSLLIFSSLSLFGLSSLCSMPRLAASALRLPSLTQSHSHTHTISLTSSATHSQVSSSSINLKLSILVFHSSHMLWLLLNVSVIVWSDLNFFF